MPLPADLEPGASAVALPTLAVLRGIGIPDAHVDAVVAALRRLPYRLTPIVERAAELTDSQFVDHLVVVGPAASEEVVPLQFRHGRATPTLAVITGTDIRPGTTPLLRAVDHTAMPTALRLDIDLASPRTTHAQLASPTLDDPTLPNLLGAALRRATDHCRWFVGIPSDAVEPTESDVEAQLVAARRALQTREQAVEFLQRELDDVRGRLDATDHQLDAANALIAQQQVELANAQRVHVAEEQRLAAEREVERLRLELAAQRRRRSVRAADAFGRLRQRLRGRSLERWTSRSRER